MRIGLAALILESNSFSPQKSDISYFKENGFILEGEEIISYHKEGIRNEIAGFIDLATQNGSEILPLTASWAVPHGIMPQKTYQYFKSRMMQKLSEDCTSFDAVYFGLHGSMVVEGIDDPEGDILKSARTILGETPIVLTLDFHANVTEKIAAYADIIVGYNSFPHDNLYETGAKASALLHSHYRHIKDLSKVFVKLPMVTPLELMTIKDNPPMKRLIEQANILEKEDGIIAVSVFGVQPWLDIQELGSSILLVARKNKIAEARSYATKLAKSFWRSRHYFMKIALYSPKQAITEGLETDYKPILLNEPSDNVGSGATGDSTYVLRELVSLDPVMPSLLTICDPSAVATCFKANVGAKISLMVGAYFNKENDTPFHVEGIIRIFSDGVYRYTGPVQTGVKTSMGRTVVVEIKEKIFLQITELPPYTIDPEHYRCVGLLPERFKFIGIKSQGSYKSSYKDISKVVYYLDTPGFSRSNILDIPFVNVDTSNLFPFNFKRRCKCVPKDFM